MVGAGRFELPTSCTPSKRASRATLRPEPLEDTVYRDRARFQSDYFEKVSGPKFKVSGTVLKTARSMGKSAAMLNKQPEWRGLKIIGIQRHVGWNLTSENGEQPFCFRYNVMA